MKVNTAKFGELEVDDSLIIHMTKPVLGFEDLKKYVIIETEDFEPFKWYQSVEDPKVSFVVVNPLLFFSKYSIEVNPKEIEELQVEDVEDIVTYAIVTLPSDFTKMTANLQGPILINTKTRLAKQLVLVNSRYKIKHRIFDSTDQKIDKKSKNKVAVGV
ncbi:MAG: flagellar assembly protein FliW [candidate division Zixibacteria bacterium]|nr:flagellar assembly protein FliW [candidate division Zixibacteria bacterium]